MRLAEQRWIQKLELQLDIARNALKKLKDIDTITLLDAIDEQEADDLEANHEA